MKIDTIVIGAGAGGLGAGCWLKNEGIEFVIMDPAGAVPMNLHNGVHYLHSIPNLPFDANLKRITLTDVIMENGEFYHKPNLKHALDYSEKVRDIQHPSSIMSVGKTDSAYMPDSNLNELIAKMMKYIGSENFELNAKVTAIDPVRKKVSVAKHGEVKIYEYEHIISTVPLPEMLRLIGYREFQPDFIYSPIHVSNYPIENIVPNWMINIYLPNKNVAPYRASILNGICSVESIKKLSTQEAQEVPRMLKMFRIGELENDYVWEKGKILSISIDQRKELVEMFADKGIYQIGRFGLWNRKLLVDSTINQAQAAVKHISVGGWKELLGKLAA